MGSVVGGALGCLGPLHNQLLQSLKKYRIPAIKIFSGDASPEHILIAVISYGFTPKRILLCSAEYLQLKKSGDASPEHILIPVISHAFVLKRILLCSGLEVGCVVGSVLCCLGPMHSQFLLSLKSTK